MFKISSPYKFNEKSENWEIKTTDDKINQPISCEKIKVGCYNVLKYVNSKFVDFFLQSKTRFDNQMNQLFPQMNFDILGLNEVTQYYLDNHLLKSEFIRKNYFITEIEVTKKRDMFNVVLSKFPMTVFRLPDREEVICFFENELGLSFIVVICHLKAFEENVDKRVKELSSLIYSIKNNPSLKGVEKAVKNENILIMGDFNLHYPYETKIIYELGFVDLWLEHGLADDVYSWDPAKNSLINRFLLFDNRRMRLDRMIISEKNKNFELIPGSMDLFANKPIENTKIFPSDHFGLYCELKIKNIPSEYEVSNLKAKESSIKMTKSDYKNQFRSIPRIIFYRIVLLIFLTLLGLFILNKLRRLLFTK